MGKPDLEDLAQNRKRPPPEEYPLRKIGSSQCSLDKNSGQVATCLENHLRSQFSYRRKMNGFDSILPSCAEWDASRDPNRRFYQHTSSEAPVCTYVSSCMS